MRNPFTPTFGVSPPLLVGREEEIATFSDGLDAGLGDPARALIITGPRGSGKTVLLNALEDRARERGWLVLSAAVRPGLAEELTRTTLPQLIRERANDATTGRVTGVEVGVGPLSGAVDREYVDHYPETPSFRSQVEKLTDVLAAEQGDRPTPRGLLISLDEVHLTAREDLREIVQTVQQCFREGREVAFLAGGLPRAVSDVLNDDVLTFLRRAEQFGLGPVAEDDVARAIADPVRDHGRSITDEALDTAVDGTHGYPFLIQLVGYDTWNADPACAAIDRTHAEVGVERATRKVGRLVHAPSLRDVSEVDRSFLAAMALDRDSSEIAELAERLGVDTNYAGQYRLRMIAAELIEPAGHGRVRFALPYLREYLEDHVVTHALAAGTKARRRRR